MPITQWTHMIAISPFPSPLAPLHHSAALFASSFPCPWPTTCYLPQHVLPLGNPAFYRNLQILDTSSSLTMCAAYNVVLHSVRMCSPALIDKRPSCRHWYPLIPNRRHGRQHNQFFLSTQQEEDIVICGLPTRLRAYTCARIVMILVKSCWLLTLWFSWSIRQLWLATMLLADCDYIKCSNTLSGKYLAHLTSPKAKTVSKQMNSSKSTWSHLMVQVVHVQCLDHMNK